MPAQMRMICLANRLTATLSDQFYDGHRKSGDRNDRGHVPLDYFGANAVQFNPQLRDLFHQTPLVSLCSDFECPIFGAVLRMIQQFNQSLGAGLAQLLSQHVRNCQNRHDLELTPGMPECPETRLGGCLTSPSPSPIVGSDGGNVLNTLWRQGLPVQTIIVMGAIIFSKCGSGDEMCPPAPIQPAYSDAICIAGGLAPGDGDTARDRRRFVLDMARAAGVRTFREEFNWGRIEPERGQFKFEDTDARMNDVTAAGAELIGLIAYGNTWASEKGRACEIEGGGDCNTFPPDDPEDYARFAARLADRYGSSIHNWEIWNEQNSGFRFWRGAGVGGDPEAYANLLKVTYKHMRDAQPSARIAYGGLFWHEQVISGAPKFLDRSLAAVPDLPNFFDVVAYHPYTLYPPSVSPESNRGAEVPLPEMHAALEEVLNVYNASGKEFWITEVGWPTAGPVTEELQAQYLVRSSILSMSVGATRVCWFTFQDGPNFGTFPPEHDFGLLKFSENDREFSPKQSFYALRAMSERLGGTRYRCDMRDRLTIQDEEYAYLFERDGGEDVLVLWRTAAEVRAVRVDDILGGLARPGAAYDIFGATVQVEGPLPLGPEPVYLTLQR